MIFCFFSLSRATCTVRRNLSFFPWSMCVTQWMDRCLHLSSSHLPNMNASCEGIPRCCRVPGEDALAALCVCPREFQETITYHHHPSDMLRARPLDPQVHQVPSVPYLVLEQHREGTNSSTLIQAVKVAIGAGYVLLLLLLWL